MADTPITEKGTFQGKDAKVTTGNTGDKTRTDIYYVGKGAADGKDHGHVVTKDSSVTFWRDPGKDKTADIDSKK